MDTALRRFLSCDELDELRGARDELGELDADARAEINRALLTWTDMQALANLLMYPRLIDEDQRVRHLSRALAEGGYLQLAAVVGLQSVGRESLRDSHRADFVRTLVGLLDSTPAILAERASVTLVELIVADELLLLRDCLNHEDAIVRHNALVAHVAVAGLEAARDLIAQQMAERALAPASREFLTSGRAELDELIAAGGRAANAYALSSLSAPRLTYIPNLRGWDAAE